MTFLLDTNVCIRMLNQQPESLVARFKTYQPQQLAICSIVKSELYYGARHSQRVEANLQRLQHFFQPLASLTFGDRCAEMAGIIRASLALQGAPIGPNDLLIAATAMANDAILVTHNVMEFSRISGLRWEDWES